MRDPDPFDNPIHAALSTLHRDIALRAVGAARYPAEVAPFFAVEDPAADATDAVAALVAPGESVYLLGVATGCVVVEAFKALCRWARSCGRRKGGGS